MESPLSFPVSNLCQSAVVAASDCLGHFSGAQHVQETLLCEQLPSSRAPPLQPDLAIWHLHGPHTPWCWCPRHYWVTIR